MSALLYLDTSALVKLYVAEGGTDEVEQAAAVSEYRFAASVIAYPEARGVFARYLRDAKFGQDEHDTVVAAFDSDWEGMNEVDVTPGIYRRAGDLLDAHVQLRAMDAIHLASVLEIRAHADVLFMTFDADLRLVAERLMPGCVRPL